MNNNESKSSKVKATINELPIEGCELSLSADGQWVRFVVDGKLVASFHVNYVGKVLGKGAAKTNEKPQRRPAPSASL